MGYRGLSSVSVSLCTELLRTLHIENIHITIVHRDIMKQYIGIIVMLIGALLQLFTYFTDQVENANLFLGTGLALVVLGFLGHIFINKKA